MERSAESKKLSPIMTTESAVVCATAVAGSAVRSSPRTHINLRIRVGIGTSIRVVGCYVRLISPSLRRSNPE
jgi:hypothetical protein